MKTPRTYYLLLILLVLAVGCKPDEGDGPDPNGHGWVYNPTAYSMSMPRNLPMANFPASNPLTQQGVKLGRMLFYDPILSGDSTLSCAGCHKQANAFGDDRIKSIGIDGLPGNRHSMPLFNLVYSSKFFWDGRANTLDAQALIPVEDPLEMHEQWPNNILKLQAHKDYPKLFYEAFGVEPEELTKEHVAKALEQFMLSLVSGNSKWDKAVRGETELTEAEERGFILFNAQDGGDCFHCHGDGAANQQFQELNPIRQFRNNGLDGPATAADYIDKGLGQSTGNLVDNGKFKVPSLRNLVFTAPYMHDGRFATLEEVVEFYSTGVHNAPNIDAGMEFAHQGGVQLTPQEKADLIAFLRALSDESFTTDPRFSNPFE